MRRAATLTRTRRSTLAAVTAGVLALTGCGVRGAEPEPTPAAQQPTPAGSAAATAGASARDGGDLPDVCALLSKAEVGALTGQDITQVDPDGGRAGDPSRFCQWQLASGQLAVFLSRSTPEEFDVKNATAQKVDGIGQDAYQLAGHLYVLYGTVVVDVYARGGSDEQNLAVAKKTVAALLPRI
jgi:hypothetical protein